MGLHSPCKLAKQCPHESETVPGTCGYHHCRLSEEEIDRLTGGYRAARRAEEYANEQLRPKDLSSYWENFWPF